MKGRTSVVIAHHLGTIRHADVIFVVKDSEIVERGTHQALLARGGVYAELYAIQTAGLGGLTPGPAATTRDSRRQAVACASRVGPPFRPCRSRMA